MGLPAAAVMAELRNKQKKKDRPVKAALPLSDRGPNNQVDWTHAEAQIQFTNAGDRGDRQ